MLGRVRVCERGCLAQQGTCARGHFLGLLLQMALDGADAALWTRSERTIRAPHTPSPTRSGRALPTCRSCAASPQLERRTRARARARHLHRSHAGEHDAWGGAASLGMLEADFVEKSSASTLISRRRTRVARPDALTVSLAQKNSASSLC